MKKYLILAFAAMCGSVFPRSVVCTVYSPSVGQCDDTPLVTADNSVIDIEELKNGRLRWCAVSRDLLQDYSYGDTIYIFISDGHPKNGQWVIHDTMNKRYSNYIDFLTYNERYGKWDATIK